MGNLKRKNRYRNNYRRNRLGGIETETGSSQMYFESNTEHIATASCYDAVVTTRVEKRFLSVLTHIHTHAHTRGRKHTHKYGCVCTCVYDSEVMTMMTGIRRARPFMRVRLRFVCPAVLVALFIVIVLLLHHCLLLLFEKRQ